MQATQDALGEQRVRSVDAVRMANAATAEVAKLAKEKQELLDRLREQKVSVNPGISASLYKLLQDPKVCRVLSLA